MQGGSPPHSKASSLARRIPTPSVPRTTIRPKTSDDRAPGFPSRDEIIAFIAEHPGEAGKRELARAFRISGAGRITLKRILKELEAEGIVQRGRGKRFSEPGTLPDVTVVNVIERDRDGELLAEPAEWDDEEFGPPPRVLILPEDRKARGPQAGVGDRVLVRISDDHDEEDLPSGCKHAARVIKVLDKKPAAALGLVRIVTGGARIIPVDKKGREIVVAEADLKGAVEGDLVALDIERMPTRIGLMRAKVRDVLGSLASEKAVSMVAIHTHQIPHIFPVAALHDAETAEPATMKGREDWRHLPLVTIDPPDAKDHDDAVHAEPDTDPDNAGGWVVTVAIADVAAYVRPGTAIDREALHRGNSVYFPDRVVPMLPERISNDLCSLKELVDRPAIAVRMIFDKTGRKRAHGFHRIMMRSAAKLAYAQAQAAIDGRPDDKTETLVEGVLRPLYGAYECLKRGRDNREPLDLDLPERKILLKPDGTVDRVIVPERLDAHKLIEEMMIMANVAAAETLEKHRVPLLYRIHDAPSIEKLQALKDFLATLNLTAPKVGAKPSHFNQILAKVVDTPNQGLVNEVVLRSQAQAEYNPQNIGHFGLNLRRYAHFTSPIRRYADLIVHRALIRALGLGPDGLPETWDQKLEAIGGEISAAERRAMMAERETIDRLIARWLVDRIGATFLARISGVTKAGLFVRLNDTGADGFIPAATLGADYFAYDEATHALIGRQSGETFRLGDRVEVKLVEAQPFAGAMRFEMLSQGSAGKPMGRGGSVDRLRRGGPPKGVKSGGVRSGGSKSGGSKSGGSPKGGKRGGR
ncbi:MAG: ribonuclease R [Hyphomicrobiaceae bacterium]|nr:ribonuclease R [Hyphomicrobiaceae bacterium]